MRQKHENKFLVNSICLTDSFEQLILINIYLIRLCVQCLMKILKYLQDLREYQSIYVLISPVNKSQQLRVAKSFFSTYKEMLITNFSFFIHLFVYVSVWAHMHPYANVHMCKPEINLLKPVLPTLWGLLEIKLRLSDLGSSCLPTEPSSSVHD